MSWTDEEIDKLFQESAKAQTFEYKNAYFSEVEAMLPVNKKGKDFLWMGTALLFIAALTTGYFVNNNAENTFDGSNDQLSKVELNNQKEISTLSSAKIEGKQSGNVIKDEALLNESTSKMNAGSGQLVNQLADGTNLNANLKSASQQQGWSKSMYNTGITEIPEQAQLATEMIGSDHSTGQINDQTTEKEPLKSLRAGTKVKTEKEFGVNHPPVTARLNVNPINQLNQGIDRDLSPNAMSPMLSELRPKSALYVELNGGMSQSLVTPEQYTSVSYGGGIGMETHLGNFNLTTGLNFKFSDHRDLILTRSGSGKLYGFGSTPTGVNTFNFKQLYSFEMPITLGYNFGKHNVNIGVRPSFAFGANMKQQTYIGEQLVRTKESLGLITEGISQFGLKPTFGYAYHLNKWTVGANIGVQLMQSVDEEYIQGINNRFPLDGQIYVRRTIRLRK